MDNGKSKFITEKIKVYGIVQGVGFRPLVYRIAKKHKICGTVRNVGGFVEIIAQGTESTLSDFIGELKDCNNSGGCEIIKLETEVIQVNVKEDIQEVVQDKTQENIQKKVQVNIQEDIFTDFTIIGSEISEETSIIPPDLPVCSNCVEELYEGSDRRFQNPFISCMSCGPRYTIIEELPYDRQNTTMIDFMMCDSCRAEYIAPDSRRFHAQTISCNDCGPYLIFHDAKEENTSNYRIEEKHFVNDKMEEKYLVNNRMKEKHHVNDRQKEKINIDVKQNERGGAERKIDRDLYNQEALEKAVSILQSGGILAVKGIGGYHFVCSPFTEETVNNLRILKGREEKPFAVMFPGIQEIEQYCVVSDEERALLQTNARPIVLLYQKNTSMAPSTNKGSIYCGAFLPYTPLQLLLTGQCGPLIMTSANSSDQPIIREDHVILALTSPYLDGVLYNTRRIIRSVDDSVAKIIDGKPQLIRRSRGYVPYPVFINQERSLTKLNSPKLPKHKMIFAAGGDLKGVYCLYKNGKAVLSQYFGDLEEVSVLEEYRKSIQDLKELLRIRPELAVCDLHPNYHSVHFAKTLGIPLLQVQHHHAHIASVIAEHDLKGKVIGVAFDGTGYGTDGNIWGGEFLVCEGANYIRAAHLSYTPVLGGDQSMKDARKTATCHLINSGLEEFVRDDRKEVIETALMHRVNTVLTSSMGRLFDAVSSLLNISQEDRYEGECAALLEREAVLAKRNHVKPEKLNFAISQKHEIMELDPKPLFEAICNLRDISNIGSLALGFHYAVAEAVGDICENLRNRCHCNTVALSGGVFQNTILTEQTLKVLRNKNFEVYGNMAVPPNDGGICLGQTYLALQENNKSFLM